MNADDLIEASKNADLAREAILMDLAARRKAGDQTVKPLDSTSNHRWHMPQKNYFSGAGEMVCPVCMKGLLKYSRSSYNGNMSAFMLHARLCLLPRIGA